MDTRRKSRIENPGRSGCKKYGNQKEEEEEEVEEE